MMAKLRMALVGIALGLALAILAAELVIGLSGGAAAEDPAPSPPATHAPCPNVDGPAMDDMHKQMHGNASAGEDHHGVGEGMGGGTMGNGSMMGGGTASTATPGG